MEGNTTSDKAGHSHLATIHIQVELEEREPACGGQIGLTESAMKSSSLTGGKSTSDPFSIDSKFDF